jgi:DNA-binding transcriptional ArsR family regulator
MMTTATIEDDQLTLIFGALADPTRRSILARLTEGEATGVELAAPFAISQQGIAKHLKVLEHAGLISRTRTAKSRTCRLEPDRLDEAVEWIARHREMWADRYDRLDAHLQTLRTQPTNLNAANPTPSKEPRP